MAARSPLDPMAGILPPDSAIARMQKHEMKEWIYALGEQLAAARSALKEPRPPKGYIYIAEADLPASFFIPLPAGRVIGENQRIESLVDESEAYKCAEVIKKAQEAQRLTKS